MGNAHTHAGGAPDPRFTLQMTATGMPLRYNAPVRNRRTHR